MRRAAAAAAAVLQAGTAGAHAGQQHNTSAETLGHQVGASSDTVILAGVLVFLAVTAGLTYLAWRLEQRNG